MDGIEAALQIWDSLQILVIYTTGYSDQATVERSLASTFFGYILKPVKERDLYLALQIAWQRQREREVSQQARASPILAALGDGVLVCDTLGRVTFLNPVAEALTGWTLADAEGQHITDVFALVDIQTQAPLPSPMTVVLQTEQTAYLVDPVLLVRRDGQRLPVADSAAPLHDANGNLSGVVIVFRDVTERELVKAFTLSEQRLQLLQQEFSQLQAQQVQKEDFLQLVSHELRTPLASIKLAVQML
jgi:PAS domain S-box-containing protein